MTNNQSRRRWWTGAAVLVGGAGLAGGKLIQSGAVAADLLSHWYGQVLLTVVGVAVAAATLFFLDCAYRR
ncbi:hypothetical protein [Actinoplanes sp. NPDC049599]|uniref:hypothetical protein n=1 Tax=Actinoplanes sp. NPDC049599 TaxID=3363903 RepID=UPI0037896B5C